jgi:zinc protease
MQVIREDRGLAYDVHSYFLPMAQTGPFLASVQTRNEQAAESRQLLVETIKRFREEGPTAKELKQAIQNITGSFPLNTDSNADLVGYLGAIGFYNMPLDHLQTFAGKIKAVTAEQVRNAFQRRLDPDRFATIILGPSATNESSSWPGKRTQCGLLAGNGAGGVCRCWTTRH